jgi:peptidoglycan hydrolase FlgJ
MATDMTSILPATESAAGEGRNWLDVQGLAALRADAARQAPSALGKVAEQFESLFLGMMLKSMREAKLGEGVFDSDSSKFYQDLYDQQLSLALSHGKGLGIARMLEQSLAPRAPAPAHPSDGRGLPGLPGLPRSTTAQPAATGGQAVLAAAAAASAGESAPVAPAGDAGSSATVAGPAVLASSPEEFVGLVLPHAVEAGAALGVSPLALVAQAALETRWGQHVPSAGEGSSFNVFGIKADAGWTGRRVAKETIEYQDGVAVRRREPFRAYESLEHGFQDLVGFLKNHARYAAALAGGADPGHYAQALQRAGYATDPGYATKINAILGSDTLRRALAALKNVRAVPIP